MKNFNQHVEKYSINESLVTVTALYNINKLIIDYRGGRIISTLDKYDNFKGDMKEFATMLIGEGG